jgi:hypothetical protein
MHNLLKLASEQLDKSSNIIRTAAILRKLKNKILNLFDSSRREKVQELLNKSIKVSGWIKTYRTQKDMTFLSLNDGSTIKNIQKMVDMSSDNGADVFVNLGYKVEGKFGDINILPVGRPANLLKKKEDWLPYVQKRRDLQKLIPTRITNATIIPVYDLQSKTSDGIHPTSAGHKIVAEKIYDSIVNT